MAKSGPKRKTSLAGFLRKLWSRPALLRRFSESREGRKEVISQFNLSARHARLLMEGCVRDIVVELVRPGARLVENTNTVINVSYGQADVACGHPECKAFMSSVAQKSRKSKKKKR